MQRIRGSKLLLFWKVSCIFLISLLNTKGLASQKAFSGTSIPTYLIRGANSQKGAAFAGIGFQYEGNSKPKKGSTSGYYIDGLLLENGYSSQAASDTESATGLGIGLKFKSYFFKSKWLIHSFSLGYTSLNFSQVGRVEKNHLYHGPTLRYGVGMQFGKLNGIFLLAEGEASYLIGGGDLTGAGTELNPLIGAAAFIKLGLFLKL